MKAKAIQHLKDAGKFEGNPMVDEMANNMAEFADSMLRDELEKEMLAFDDWLHTIGSKAWRLDMKELIKMYLSRDK